MFPLLLALLGYSLAVPECPRYSTAFDYQSCDPKARSQCPAGYTCRNGNDSSNPSDRNIFLCCDSSVMTVADWFEEAGLVPEVFPENPTSTIKSVQLTPVEPNTKFPWVHIGDEVVVLSYPNYVTGMVDKVNFSHEPAVGGLLHYLTIVDPGYHPYALFFSYNEPSYGLSSVSIGSSGNRIAFVDNSSTVPLRSSSEPTMDARTIMDGCKDVTCVLSNSTLGRELGRPIAGTLFYLTTKRTIFDTRGEEQRDKMAPGMGLWLTFVGVIWIVV